MVKPANHTPRQKKLTKPNKHTTIEKNTGDNHVSEYKEFRDMCGRVKIYTDRYVEGLAHELPQWAWEMKKKMENPDKTCAYTIEDFHYEKGIPGKTWDDWIVYYKVLYDANHDAKIILGLCREAGALHRKMEPSTVHKVQRHYSKIWSDIQKEDNATRIKDSNYESDTKYILIPDIAVKHED